MALTNGPQVGRVLRARNCLRWLANAGGPYRINLSRHSIGRDCTELLRCASTQPPPPGGVIAPPVTAPALVGPLRTGMFAPAMLTRLQHWAQAWSRVYNWADNLPRKSINFQVNMLRDMLNLLDREFWGGTVVRTIVRRGFNLGYILDNHPHQDMQQVIPRSDGYPVAAVRMERNHAIPRCILEINTHPSFQPRYPFYVDGIIVRHWRYYFCHVVAHEMIHLVRIILGETGATMYNATWLAINRWVYGHTNMYDDTSLPVDIEEIDD